MILADPIVNVPGSAALYAQVAALLAGFAFTGLMVYLARPAASSNQPAPSKLSDVRPDQAGVDSRGEQDAAERRQREGAVALSLMATLISLVVVAVLYGILAGGPSTSGAAHLGLMIYSTAFALAVLSLFHSAALIASPATNLHHMIVAARLWTSVVGPTVGMMLVGSTALNLHFHEFDPTSETFTQLIPDRPFGLALVLSLVVLVIGARDRSGGIQGAAES